MRDSFKRILIYHLGSLGDTVVALPALHLIARSFQSAERLMLTNFSISSKAAPLAQVLDGSGLVHGYVEYPIGMRDFMSLLGLIRRIRALRIDVLVYLTEPRGQFKAFRDALFFKACGIRQLIGIPYSAQWHSARKLENGQYEYIGSCLARCIRELGNANLDDPGSFDLVLSDVEKNRAKEVLGQIGSGQPVIAASVGAKDDVKDWGNDNWAALLKRLSQTQSDWVLVMIGAGVERKRSQALLRHWAGPSCNCCGNLSVRESAAVVHYSRLFIGHDSGPMHLAAAVGTPCVAIFSSRNLPGEWFPYGAQHRVLYHPVDCQGCQLRTCEGKNKACISSITVAEVLEAVLKALKQ